jgi:hypothetical protein
LNINVPGSLSGKSIELRLYNLTGNLVEVIFKGKPEGDIIIWKPDKSKYQLSPGIYFLKLSSGSSIREAIKLIKI